VQSILGASFAELDQQYRARYGITKLAFRTDFLDNMFAIDDLSNVDGRNISQSTTRVESLSASLLDNSDPVDLAIKPGGFVSRFDIFLHGNGDGTAAKAFVKGALAACVLSGLCGV